MGPKNKQINKQKTSNSYKKANRFVVTRNGVGRWVGGELEKEMATHSSVLSWRIPGTGEPGGLPSMGLHRVGHD